jgi:hypothetical protein
MSDVCPDPISLLSPDEQLREVARRADAGTLTLEQLEHWKRLALPRLQEHLASINTQLALLNHKMDERPTKVGMAGVLSAVSSDCRPF